MWKICSLKQVKSPISRTLTILADGNGTNNGKAVCPSIILDFKNPNSSVPFGVIDKTNLKNYQFPVMKISYDRKDIVEHARSMGIKADDEYANFYLDESYEKLQVLPSFLFPFMNKMLLDLNSRPPKTWKLSLERMLHGEHSIQHFKQLPPEGIVNIKINVSDVLEKWNATFYNYNMNVYDENSGEKYCTMSYQIIEVGVDGFIGKKSNRKVTSSNGDAIPPNSILEFQTFVPKDGIRTEVLDTEKSFSIYSLFYPLQHYGKPLPFIGRPITHGRYTFGGVMKTILFKYGNGNSDNLKFAKVRFAKPVFPGDNILISVWKPADGTKINFQGDVRRDGETVKVLTDGYIELANMEINNDRIGNKY